MQVIKEKNMYIFFLIPMFLLFTFVAIFPLIYEIWLSFRQYNIARPWYPSGWVGLANFHEILTDPKFWNSLRITIIFVVAAVSIEFFLGLAIAFLFSKRESSKGNYIARALIMSSMVLPSLSVGMIWRYLLNDSFGAVAVWLKDIGINFGWYGNVDTALITMIFIDVWQWTPFIFLILLAGIISLPKDIYEAAQVDGASEWEKFINLTLPLLKSVIIVALLLRMLEAFKVFDMVWMLTKGGPIRATEVIGIFIYIQAFISYNLGYAAALALILLAFSISITIVFIKISKFEM